MKSSLLFGLCGIVLRLTCFLRGKMGNSIKCHEVTAKVTVIAPAKSPTNKL
jgi:hypothetical protein